MWMKQFCFPFLSFCKFINFQCYEELFKNSCYYYSFTRRKTRACSQRVRSWNVWWMRNTKCLSAAQSNNVRNTWMLHDSTSFINVPITNCKWTIFNATAHFKEEHTRLVSWYFVVGLIALHCSFLLIKLLCNLYNKNVV